MYVHKALGTKAIIRRGGMSKMFIPSLMNKLMRIEWVNDWVSEWPRDWMLLQCLQKQSEVPHGMTTSYPWAKNEVMMAWKCCIIFHFFLLWLMHKTVKCYVTCIKLKFPLLVL